MEDKNLIPEDNNLPQEGSSADAADEPAPETADAAPSTSPTDGEAAGGDTPQKSGKQKSGAQKKKSSRPLQAKKPGKPKKKRKPLSTSRMLVNLLIKIGVIAAVVWLTLTFVLGVTIHYGNNMHPAVRDGDLIITLRLQRPYINAAVMYEHDGKTNIGRVIGLPGNEIRISDKGEITVNGIIPSEEVFYATYAAENSGITYPYTVPEDCVFILNDFRSDTNDSRSFGAVPMKDLDGPILLSIRRRGF